MHKINYIAKSRASLEALKSANLLKSLNINVLVYGECGVGKRTLCRYIFEDAPIVDGSSLDELEKVMELNTKLIITNFDKIKGFDKIKNIINVHKNRIIATTSKEINNQIEDHFFSLKILIPPLRQRDEDVKALSNLFYKEAKTVFGDLSCDIDLNDIDIDLSENSHSLKQSIYKAYFMSTLSEENVLNIFEKFLYKKLEDGNDYRTLMRFFDIPLIKSGFKQFNSQLSLSEAFGINRNTLRKKIKEYNLEFH